MKRASALLLMLACEKSEPPSLASPVDAAKCQRSAIKARSTKQWIACMHPLVLADGVEKFEKKAQRDEFWEKAERKSAALDSVKESDFTIKPTNDSSVGDSNASYRLENDSFELIRKDGRWYIVDTGI
jgi:hypothetical protein